MSRPVLDQQYLKSLLQYDPDSGNLVWLVSRKAKGAPGGKVGCLAGTISSLGYRYIGIDQKRYLAHRLAFLWMTGEWPAEFVDHIDGDPSNNSWSNLRSVSQTLNLQNRKSSNEKRGILLGVHKDCRRIKRPWVAQISFNGTTTFIGNFSTEQEAHMAYVERKRLIHPGNML